MIGWLLCPIFLLTIDLVAFVLFGSDRLSRPEVLTWLAATNLVAAGLFFPFARRATPAQAPSKMAAASFSSALLAGQILLGFFLIVLAPQLIIALEIVAVGLFLFAHAALAAREKNITTEVAGKHGSQADLDGARRLQTAVSSALQVLSNSPVGPLSTRLERLERRARRQEIDFSKAPADALRRIDGLAAAARDPSNRQAVENAAAELLEVFSA